jgi:uncharacterized protein
VTVLLDGNVLVALTVEDHLHHAQAEAWLAARPAERFASTPITQGTLLRLLIRHSVRADDAVALLARVASDRRHTFWSDDLEYDTTMLRGVIGHRQVTDAYLAGLARHHGGRIATFDIGLASSHSDVTDLISTS